MAAREDVFAPWHGVFETLRVIDGVPLFVTEHLSELKRAMEALGLESDFDFNQARTELPSLSGRWRWIVTPGETKTLFTEETEPSSDPVALSVSPVRVGSYNWDARFKTLSYLSHAQALKTAATPEVILLNEHGHVASGARSNIFWRAGKILFTPSHEAGCRRGVVSSFVQQYRMVKVGQFPSSDLFEADEIFLTNSIRGIVSVSEIEKRSLADFSEADSLHQEYATEIAQQLQKHRI
jgi:branched-subunit amino acid aminotransferase/4-amino-4-deoxychorismate lyase